MKLVLTKDMFTNDEYSVSYSNKKALFVIIDEAFVGTGVTSVEINRLVCTITEYDDSNNITGKNLTSLLIGIGDGRVGVTTTDSALLGKLMTKDNMASCVVNLYE